MVDSDFNDEPEVDESDSDEAEAESERGQMDEASDRAFERWAERYDELNGAPESEEDR